MKVAVDGSSNLKPTAITKPVTKSWIPNEKRWCKLGNRSHAMEKNWINTCGDDKVGKSTKLVPMSFDTRALYLDFVKSRFSNFRNHKHRVIEQFRASKILKRNLNDDQVSVQMDFAQNYTCSVKEEAPPGFFAKTKSTVHPVAIHCPRDKVEI